MKVTLYMAISTNGMIAKSNDDTSWITEEEWNSYSSAVRKAGNLIVGKRTYDILTKQPEFSEFKDVKVVAVSKEGKVDLVGSNHSIAVSPKEALEILKDFSEVIVAGGGTLNNSFLSENLIDEIYLDIEPIIISGGIPIFKGEEFEKKLKLININKLNEDVIQLHYKVIK